MDFIRGLSLERETATQIVLLYVLRKFGSSKDYNILYGAKTVFAMFCICKAETTHARVTHSYGYVREVGTPTLLFANCNCNLQKFHTSWVTIYYTFGVPTLLTSYMTLLSAAVFPAEV